jgi:hypothetical protein
MVTQLRVELDGGKRSGGRHLVAAAMIAVVALASVSCGGDDLDKTSEGFSVEPAAEPGPHAFTASVAKEDIKDALGVAPAEDGGETAQAGDSQVCDTKRFVKELQGRPDAYREWGRVLGVPAADIPAYIEGLDSTVLPADAKVTNHGLKNGKAYPRASVLTKGTAVLVDRSSRRRSVATSSSVAPTATAPGGGVIVTRCKCGNPLLPPVDPKTIETEPPGTEPPGTAGTVPGSIAPTSTRGTTTRAASTTTRSAATSTTAAERTTTSAP